MTTVIKARIRAHFVWIGLVATIYAAFAAWTVPYHADALTNAATAWNIGVRGTPIIAEAEPSDMWIIAGTRGPISQYPPGTALLAAPLYAITRPPLGGEVVTQRNPTSPIYTFPAPPVWQATLIAVLTATGTAAFVRLTLEQFASLRPIATRAVVALAFGTGLFSVASDALWQHGPASMVLAAGFWLMATSRQRAAAIVFGGLALIRPIALIIPVAAFAVQAIQERTWRPLLSSTLAMWGPGALLLYNAWAFGIVSIGPGYAATGLRPAEGVVGLLSNVAAGFVDPARGVLMVSPFLIPLAAHLRGAWANSTPLSRGMALGGLGYFLAHLILNRYTGGGGFFGYRYPIESLVVAAPLLCAAYERTLASRIWRTMTHAGVVVAIALQTLWSALT